MINPNRKDRDLRKAVPTEQDPRTTCSKVPTETTE